MTSLPPRQPTIARIWRGRTARARADEYEAYNYEAGIKPLLAKALGLPKSALSIERGDTSRLKQIRISR